MSKTLVIHPQDKTTDFLKVIYEGKGYDVITVCNDDAYLREQIKSHDRIIMLGHGTWNGLLRRHDVEDYIIDDSHADLLREKETISIWCYSDRYFRRNNISGFHTSMIISETLEELFMLGSVPLDDDAILANMYQFANACRDAIDFAPKAAAEYVLAHYTGSDPVTSFNRKSIVLT